MKKFLLVLMVLLLSIGFVFAQAKAEAQAEVEEFPTLKFLNFNVTYNMNDCIEYQDIEKSTGIKALYEVLPSENASEVLMLTLSMDNDYDAAVIKSAADFRTLMSSGALLALNDTIDQYAPELWDLCSKDVWRGVSDENGNVYALPATASVTYEINTNMVVRLDLAEAAGLGRELPSTATEFYQYCKALKDFYGDKYIILAAPDASTLSISKCIMSAFGIYSDWMLDDNGKVIYMTEHKNYKAMIEFMNRLYEEGILDADYAINNASKINAKMSAGQSIITMNGRATISTVYASLHKNFPDVTLEDLGYIPYLHADDGTATVQLNDGYSIFTIIPKSAAAHAKYVVQYTSAKVKNQEYCFIGTEGVHFNWDTDGYPVPIQPAFTDERNRSNNYLIMKDNDLWELQFYARLRKSEAIWSMFKVCSIDINKNEPEVWVKANFAFNNCEAYSQYNSNLQSNLKTLNIQLITGVKDYKTALDEFKREFVVTGGDEVRTQLQTYIDAK
ncbi:MAG: hypothetical protein AB9828_08735 [Sphaerochaetaceae bacterium]